jgi:hypothetical protein
MVDHCSASEGSPSSDLAESSYPVSHLRMRSAKEVEMKMKIARRMFLCLMFDGCEVGSTRGGGGEPMTKRCVSLILTLNHEGLEAQYVSQTLTANCL